MINIHEVVDCSPYSPLPALLAALEQARKDLEARGAVSVHYEHNYESIYPIRLCGDRPITDEEQAAKERNHKEARKARYLELRKEFGCAF